VRQRGAPRAGARAPFTTLKVMVDLRKLPVRDKKGDVYVVVETPRGSAAKLEFDPDLQLFTLSKSLILGLSYPYDWGFIPSTEGEDGDPIDALILHDRSRNSSSQPTNWKTRS
jgi:inorganic pyrophosphatase